MQRGDIVLMNFPFTDFSSDKRRPEVVVSGKLSNKNDVIIAFISSSIPIKPEATDYQLSIDHKDFLMTGLKKTSIIKLDKLATINVSIVLGNIGKLSDHIMAEIDPRLKLALALK